MVKKDALTKKEDKGLQVNYDTVKKYLCPIATDKEIELFITQCKMWNLNPFIREIYLIKYKADQPAQFVVGFEEYLKRAERSAKLKGWKVWTEGSTENVSEFKACIKIWRVDWDEPFEHEVFYDEYVQHRWDFKTKGWVKTKFWKDKARTMLKKVAISQGFRLCFSTEIGGMPYTAEEMPVEHEKLPTEAIEAEVIEEKKEEKKKPEPKKKATPTPKPKPKPAPITEPDKPETPPEEKPDLTVKKPEEGGLYADRDMPTAKDAEIAPPEPEQPSLPEPEEVETDEVEVEGAEMDKSELPYEETPKDKAIKKYINDLITDYGQDMDDLANRIHKSLKGEFKTVKAKIPDDLDEAEKDFLIQTLELTIKGYEQVEEEERELAEEEGGE